MLKEPKTGSYLRSLNSPSTQFKCLPIILGKWFTGMEADLRWKTSQNKLDRWWHTSVPFRNRNPSFIENSDKEASSLYGNLNQNWVGLLALVQSRQRVSLTTVYMTAYHTPHCTLLLTVGLIDYNVSSDLLSYDEAYGYLTEIQLILTKL